MTNFYMYIIVQFSKNSTFYSTNLKKFNSFYIYIIEIIIQTFKIIYKIKRVLVN